MNPVKTGYYWVRNLTIKNAPPEACFYTEPQIVEIVMFMDNLEIEYCGSEEVNKLYNVSGEWHGPIEPPE